MIYGCMVVQMTQSNYGVDSYDKAARVETNECYGECIAFMVSTH